jgi:hypothetical protein
MLRVLTLGLYGAERNLAAARAWFLRSPRCSLRRRQSGILCDALFPLPDNQISHCGSSVSDEFIPGFEFLAIRSFRGSDNLCEICFSHHP